MREKISNKVDLYSALPIKKEEQPKARKRGS